jgi:hypothetical protein
LICINKKLENNIVFHYIEKKSCHPEQGEGAYLSSFSKALVRKKHNATSFSTRVPNL